MRTDVLMATYNSEKYLDAVLNSMAQTVPVNRLIVVDHHSTDRTLKILEDYDAEIYSENIGLGYARQLAIEKAETEIVTFIDSDLLITDSLWWRRALNLLNGYCAVVAVVEEVNLSRGRRKYYEYWLLRGRWMTLGSTLIRRECLKDIQIPPLLGAHEDIYLQREFRSRGFKIRHFKIDGSHFCDYTSNKNCWRGANARIFEMKILKRDNQFILPRIWKNFFSYLIPMFTCHDPAVLTESIGEGMKYLKGWIQYDKYRVLNRSSPR